MLGLFSPFIFLGPAQRRRIRRGVPVFTYHRISRAPAGTRDPYLYVSPERFEEQLTALRQLGCACASLSDLRAGADQAEPKAVITFDDGFGSVLENGLEILKRQRFRAIQFLVAGYLGRENAWDIAKGDVAERLMDEAQIREWLAAGHEVGSHSMTHRNLRHLSAAEAREEIAGSKKALEDRFGQPVRHFSYPYGSWNEAVRDQVIGAGYETACTMRCGVNDPAISRFELRRIIPLSSGELLGKIAHRAGRMARGRKA